MFLIVFPFVRFLMPTPSSSLSLSHSSSFASSFAPSLASSLAALLGLLCAGALWGCASGGGQDGGAASLDGSSDTRRDPHEMLAKTRKATFVFLGTPDLNRREGRTMQWQYRGDACTLDVFFIAKGNEAIAKKALVQHFELRPSSSELRLNRGELQRCYARLVKERRKSARSRKKG